MYGKIIDGKFQAVPNPITIGVKTIANPTADILSQQGYLPVITTNPPNNDGCYYTPIYSERDGKICQEWEEHKLEEENDEIAQIKKQVNENAEQITATQEALCELYETVV